ncbi:hypothetical protein OOK31_07250 [Streptomyces sp. NBC_00249]|uniref:hypothetical protein n=1 Tax=Streptomyces sp. NBC_00249 TaxID=2975690 RepID=UPI00224E4B9B|nr:hypothetical protein [Streptomyces sp. NBC_00249]MCX5193689.1 hypothetical protein [Streptomyces sp. NBC_00249]
MDVELELTAPQDPGDLYRLLPQPPSCGPRDLVVTLRRPAGGKVGLSLWGDSRIVPQPSNGTLDATLETDAERLEALSARLISHWQRFVEYQPEALPHQPLDKLPFKRLADLSGRPPAEVLAKVAFLAAEGRNLLSKLLAGDDRELAFVRTRLLDVLARRDLRIRFVSDLDIPWSMLAVGPAAHDAGTIADPFDAFLGHRHQIEALTKAYPSDFWYVARHTRPVASVNADEELTGKPLAPEVRKLLDDRTELTERFLGTELLDALRRPALAEDLMYFFCHGRYTTQGAHTWQEMRLSDPLPIDGELVDSYREPHTEANARDGTLSLFHPMVVLNVCFAGAPAASGYHSLSAAFVLHGATGVLAPRIEMPQVFGAEFALRFLTRYVVDGLPAGLAVLETVRWFAAEYRNPLALTYGLVCGLDSRLVPEPQEGPTP